MKIKRFEDIGAWQCRDHVLRPDLAPLIMGVLNVTPDSFSDGGRFANTDAAVAHALAMAEAGADIVDIGGESTRPGAAPVPAEMELERVLPVVRALAGRTACALSVDTAKSAVAAAALEAGAHIINDVTALTADPGMLETARRYGAGVILMHCQGTPQTMQHAPQYTDVVREVTEYLAARLAAARNGGLAPQTLAVDPGIGFGKTTRHNLQLLAHLEVLCALGRPLVLGLSRKRFLCEITGRKVGDRQAATLAALTCALLGGANVLRVHDVADARDAARVTQALQKEGAKS